MKHYYVYASIFLCGLLYSPTAEAQDQAKVKQRIEAANGTPAFIAFENNGAAHRSDQATEVLKKYLNLSAADEMRAAKSEKDDVGYTHQRYEQFYKGIKVEHAAYLVHSKNGVVQSINGDFRKVSDVSTKPALSEKAALSSALIYINAEKYMWQVPAQEQWAKQLKNDPKATFYPKGELVLIKDGLATTKENDGKHVLAYKFDIYAHKPVSRDYVYVNAQTGEVVFKDAIIKHATATGTAATRYSGSRSITTDSYNGSYRLRELTRGNGIETYNCKTGTSYSAAVDFTDNDNSWTSGEHNNTAKDNAALDAHWAAQMTYDYFKNKHSRNSYDNAGAKIKSYVHYDSNYENAFWNGSVMTYGDGATRFDALTSLDVGAHEIGHAVCSNSANLVYQNESGAMNEGFSDIWGAAVEYYAAPEKSIWLIGEDIDKQRPSLRSMSDPNAEGQPDTYKGDMWYSGTGDNGGVHYNSGVLNHWFYILSVGKSGTNDIGNSYSVTGIGIDAAARIAYRTETVYLTSSSVYADARTYSIQSAIDLYGAGSAQVIQTTNAWHAVGIGGKYGDISYCTSQGNNSSYEWIASVKIGSFTKTSSAAGYSDFTGTTVSVNAGSSYAITLTPGFSGTAYNEYWKIWIDYNKDGDFNDTGELVYDAGALSKTAVSGTITIPSTASGSTRMRVSMKYNGAQTSCESFGYGEVEDYTISISGATATCAVPGSLSATNIGSSSATLNWGVVSGASSYNVRFRPTGTTTWTTGSVTSTSANATGLTASTQYEFQVSTVCSGSSSAYSSSYTFTTAAATVSYCASKGSNASYEWIDLVEFGGFKNATGSDGGYKDYTSLTANVVRGSSNTIYISAGFSGTAYTEYWKVWIDFNQNGSFDDSGELVVNGSSSSSGTLSATVNVPSTALLGKTRMRVSMKYNAAQTSCETFSYGEVEDYSVNIGTSLSASLASSVVNAELLGDDAGPDVVVYPNPTSNYILVSTPAEKATVQVMSITGIELLRAEVKGANQRVDVSSLPSGIYMIRIHDGQKETHQRLIKE
ncbi:M4 family metallopeptidase [Pontibacter cellulosilyticus]|uniref:M4 family metallopeptidase n=1 Tax=Pontibacter cellulosilyticus TaxID=1720253 RepID=A0A923SM22_9BACT|nr:M4 family metallopeptidase [Pontibacter cellulosilyticus]MBC5991735.1 M4 family metallopeptidase [Pontibacter cellulosilyticus]